MTHDTRSRASIKVCVFSGGTVPVKNAVMDGFSGSNRTKMTREFVVELTKRIDNTFIKIKKVAICIASLKAL